MNFVKVVFMGLLACLLLTVACKTPSYTGDDKLLKQIYRSQEKHYNTKRNPGKNDYISIINFGSRGREKLYKKYGINIREQNLIILEGYSPGWGYYCGLLISDKGNYNYRKSDKGIREMELVNINSDDIREKTGIAKDIIDKVSAWDTLYINNKKKELGALVRDGLFFMATRVQYINGKHPKIETITFREYPAR